MSYCRRWYDSFQIIRNPVESSYDKKVCGFALVSALFSFAESKSIRALSDFQYPAVFPSEFSVLPKKINEYLRADSPSDANSRKIRDLRKTLDINNLHPRGIFPLCNKHCFSTWYCPFQRLICAISHHEMGKTGGWNRHYRSARWIIRGCTSGYTTRLSGRNKPFRCRI